MHLARHPYCENCKKHGVLRSKGTGHRMIVDHIVPKAAGGSNADENLQTLCQSCHNAKTHADQKGEGK